jgi:hypothetical protein
MNPKIVLRRVISGVTPMRGFSVRLFLLVSCFTVEVVPAQAPKIAAARASAEEEIREAVLRKQMAHWIKPIEQGEIGEDEFCEFYISVEDKDPSEDLLKRFADIPRIVKAESGAMVASEGAEPSCRKGPTARQITFYVEKIRWRSKTSVQLDGGYHCGLLCASGVTYRLRLKSGKWTIVKEKANWFS